VIKPSRLSLPVDAILSEAVAHLERENSLVLQATPGSGKTTRLPPALLGAKFPASEKAEILVLEPRRLAAKYAARRVADELGEPVGETVGYQFRFENITSPRTRLRFLTEGMLMRRLINDPYLKNVGAVVLDEFHERHLHGDTALAYLKYLQQTSRPDLRIVVMSATLDTEAVATYLGGCKMIDVETRQHPVAIEHVGTISVREAISTSLDQTDGDFLVFLPGMAEIRRTAEALEELASRHGLLVLPLHGELTREEQDRAIGRANQTKIILATNVAETSLTIEGITTVIDSGLHRIASYTVKSGSSGVPSLRTRAISRASAIQRAGRAGRTAPGRCLRLYTKGEFDSRPPFETPEIRRADLSQTFLELKSMGVSNLRDFPWFEAPSNQALEASQTLLYRLGAVSHADGESSLTPVGRRMVDIPAHPRLARLLIEAERCGCLEDGATLAALIHEGRLEHLDALESLRLLGRDPSITKTRIQLLKSFDAKPGQAGSSKRDLAYAVLAGFPDRVARKRTKTDPNAAEIELLLSSGGNAMVANGAMIVGHDTFVTLDLQEKQNLGQARAQLKIYSLCAIQEDWLIAVTPSPIAEREDLVWDRERQRLSASRKMMYDQVVISESVESPLDLEAAARFILREALKIDVSSPALVVYDWIRALTPLTDPEILESAFARIQLISSNSKEISAPTAKSISDAVVSLMAGKLSWKALLEIDWPIELGALLAGVNPSLMDNLAPTHVTLAGGRRTRIHYRLDKAPWIESRLQDFFGMKKGPAILRGTLPLTLHLLAPNQRPLQVTQDLAGFWERHYPAIRSELS